ncbi:MAG: NADH-quinone oxidoreductase subunit A [Chloroflexi bacterium]|nr:NADH-quinone oxidoreductase subunit A [Chloroflexota bacterium]
MLADFGYIGLFAIVAIGFGIVTISIPIILTFLRVIPRKPSPVKADTYECGMKTVGSSWVRFNVHYYFYALLFVALDVLVIFLYPWAVQLRQLDGFAFAGMIVFIALIVVGYIYAWKKKVLEWK